MGGLVSSLFGWWGKPALDTTPDPATGLSEKDKALIRETWAVASDKKILRKNGVELFVQLFNTYPYVKDYFPQFKGMTDAELRKSPKMGAHATNVMYLLTSFVDNMDDTEILVGLVEKMSTSHLKRGLKFEDFENLKAMFIPFLRSLLGPHCTQDIEDAYTRLLTTQNALFKQMQDKYESGK